MTTEAWLIGLHLLSAHAPNCYEQHGKCVRYESATDGVYAKAPSGFTFGGFTNSYGNPSAYAGWTFETADKRFAVLVAGATGYRQAAIVPLIAPSVRIELTHRTALRIAGMPKLESGGAAVLHIAIEREL